MEFKEILRIIMAEKDLTQADLCRMTNIPTSLMSNYIKGSKSPALSNAKLIADALSISLDVLSGKDTKNQPQELSLEIDIEELIGCYKLCSNENREELLMLARYNALKNTIAAAGGELA
jgi:transcriptional regulator with XRE-family HTH domain